jgi:prevent-host-death family protein
MSIPVESLSTSDAREQFAQLLNRVYRRESRIELKRSGIPVAALVSTDDLDRLERLDRETESRLKLLEDARRPFRDVPYDELEVELSKAIAEARAELRAERAGRTPGG